jgi:hypothetical protein
MKNYQLLTVCAALGVKPAVLINYQIQAINK